VPSRALVVSDPYGVLMEFGCELLETVEVGTWDTIDELHYLVLHERPLGTEAFSDEQRAALVTHDSMNGVRQAPTRLRRPDKRTA